MLYGNLGVNFFSNSELLHPNMKVRLQLISASHKYYMIIHDLISSLGLVECSFYTHAIVLRDENHKKPMEVIAIFPMEYNYLKTLANTFIIPARHTDSS